MSALLEQMERELPSEFGVETPEGLVYHYTDAAGLEGILRRGVIWATHFAHLNDRRELIEGEDLVREVAHGLVGKLPTPPQNDLLQDFITGYDDVLFSRLAKDVYVASFSEEGDDLGQWRAYGGRGGGYAIGFAFNVASDEASDKAARRGLGQTMGRVRYDREAMKATVARDLVECFAGIESYVRTYGHKVDPKDFFAQGMVAAYRRAARIAPIYKHHAFSGEREWRLIASLFADATPDMIKTRPSDHGIVPFLELELEPGKPPPPRVERLIVGPTQDRDRGIRAAQLFLRSIGYDAESAAEIVVPSEVPFRG